ncbi:hypothetical protein C5N14_27150 [Micromonospora sp. MW-13]|nr:hypothetical protein C5N14_27150 [Micromonospora sp. MW-13]
MATTISTSSAAPDTTTAAGPFTAATSTAAPVTSMTRHTSASDAATAAITPPAGNACINRPRAATSVHASSNDNIPAAYAAVTSPTECPAKKSARTPHDRNNSHNATSTANNPACANTVRSSAPGDPPDHTTSRNEPGSSPSISPHTRSKDSANTPNRSYNSRPIPTRCEP